MNILNWFKNKGISTQEEFNAWKLDLYKKLDTLLNTIEGKEIFDKYLNYRIDIETADLHNLLLIEDLDEVDIRRKEQRLMKLLAIKEFFAEIRGEAEKVITRED